MKYALFLAAILGVTSCASSGNGGDDDDGTPDAGGTTACDGPEDCVDDGLYCNGGLVCRDSICQPTEPPSCGDGIVCTVDSCSEELLGCMNLPDDSLCDEGFACLDGEGCGIPPACEFTTDCSDDAFICNGSPECIDGECINVPLDCADTDACTSDACVEGTGCTNDPYDTQNDVDHCGAACTPCPDPLPAQVHVVRECNAGVCGFVCEAGYWDVNANMADGCEIACGVDPISTPDLPDDGFTDTNCDGIDGTIGDAIFVAEDGSNANPGTMAFPVRNLATGITKAIAGGKDYLIIAAGNYNETVTIDTTNQGIHLHGGYLRASGWARDGTRGVVTGPRTGALRVNNVTTATIVEYLRFEGATATGASQSSHAIVITGSTGLQPRYLTAVSGNGANGTQGANAGTVGDDGGNGTPGTNGYEDDGYWYCAGNQTDPPTDYNGGDSCSGAISSTRGGNGKRGCITNGGSCAGTGGDAGSPNPAGTPSDGGAGNAGNNGNGGYNGNGGGTGTNGSAGNGGQISGTTWAPFNGGNGARGGDGTGGGGGAGGGSNHSTGTCNDWGGGGGGGGGGGCGGTAGDGGTGGGGSIAVLLINSTITAEYIEAITGTGGAGGAGRSGGNGGPGGAGAGGGAGNDEGRAGGSGGNGGNGGRGGHGGGGAGGWVVGVYLSASTWNDGSTTEATLGAAGSGGTSSGNPGVTGGSYDVYP